MYTRYYDSYPTVTKNEEPCEREETKCLPEPDKKDTCNNKTPMDSCRSSGILKNLKSDDILLIALLFITASDNDDNFLMPLILGALLIL